MSEHPFASLKLGSYRAILADPAWSFRTYSAKGLKKSPQAHYQCMTLDELKALPVADLAAPDCALTMWTTSPMLDQSLELLKAWGFQYKAQGAWAKRSKTGDKWAFGTGYCYRSATEFWLLGTRGRPKPRSHSIRNLIVAPVREHSRKPDQMRHDVEALWEGPYVELFARERAPGWDSWGNQADQFTQAELAA